MFDQFRFALATADIRFQKCLSIFWLVNEVMQSLWVIKHIEGDESKLPTVYTEMLPPKLLVNEHYRWRSFRFNGIYLFCVLHPLILPFSNWGNSTAIELDFLCMGWMSKGATFTQHVTVWIFSKRINWHGSEWLDYLEKGFSIFTALIGNLDVSP